MTEPLAQIKFGTDGWRAVIAREFTFANVERVSQAYADFLIAHKEEPLLKQLVDVGQVSKEEAQTGLFKNVIKSAIAETQPLIVVGFDRRFLSENFAKRSAEIMVANGFRLALFQDAQPTPLISWTVKELAAMGGIMITASPWGGSAAPETTSAVEKLVDAHAPKRGEILDDGHQLIEPCIKRYREQISSYIDLDKIRRASGTVIIDPMHGSAGDWVEGFLKGDSLAVEIIRAYRDPLFGGVNPEPIDQNLGPLKKRVVETRALVGLATDGDADRVGAVDERGQTMTMHDVVPLLLLHLSRQRKMSGAVVVTVSQSVLTKRIAKVAGLKLYETPVGFKYIADLMRKEDILLGAEESGGIGVKGHIPERDGVLNSLLFLEAIIAAGKPPSEMLWDLHQEFGAFYFGRRDLHMPVARGQELVLRLAHNPPGEFAGYAVTETQSLDGAKLIFDDDSWLLFRQSGTEPALRVYSEAPSREKMNALLDAGEKLTRQ